METLEVQKIHIGGQNGKGDHIMAIFINEGFVQNMQLKEYEKEIKAAIAEKNLDRMTSIRRRMSQDSYKFDKPKNVKDKYDKLVKMLDDAIKEEKNKKRKQDDISKEQMTFIKSSVRDIVNRIKTSKEWIKKVEEYIKEYDLKISAKNVKLVYAIEEYHDAITFDFREKTKTDDEDELISNIGPQDQISKELQKVLDNKYPDTFKCEFGDGDEGCVFVELKYK